MDGVNEQGSISTGIGDKKGSPETGAGPTRLGGRACTGKETEH